jgi:thioredoxin-like negative regulator of GroEL
LLGVAAGIARCFADAGECDEARRLLCVIEGQPAVPARVRVRRLEPLRALLGDAATKESAERTDADDLRAALERCVQGLLS